MNCDSLRVVYFSVVIAVVLLLRMTSNALCQDLTLEGSPYDTNNFAIVIGVDDYRSDEILDLRWCEKDADLFARTLVSHCGYSSNQVLKLTGADATLENILTALANLTDPNLHTDTNNLVFYFSGHGVSKDGVNYLIPQDGTPNPALIERLNIPLDQIESMLASSNYQRQLVFIDACRSNLTQNSRSATSGSFSDVALADQYASGMKILFGTEFGEVSRERDDIGHGLFTYFLAEGMKGGAADEQGIVTIGSLEGFVFDNMASYSRLNPGLEQIPVSRGEGSSSIILGVVDPERVEEPLVELSLGQSTANSGFVTLEVFPYNARVNLRNIDDGNIISNIRGGLQNLVLPVGTYEVTATAESFGVTSSQFVVFNGLN